jgi:hypothetical protein
MHTIFTIFFTLKKSGSDGVFYLFIYLFIKVSVYYTESSLHLVLKKKPVRIVCMVQTKRPPRGSVLPTHPSSVVLRLAPCYVSVAVYNL